ncbi:unnamed protein product [Didymodactylos carnosus]|uniref:Uncharacterized protein n=1 Tax=Didymodactylos carnosus TaxID=1234261 RepID=A0A8S2KQC8_9BILA|nr:unnamed protein product [Didymodactylos carnosus]CAF3864348.1 unnamed protein product [Didymodactylos carnosus]
MSSPIDLSTIVKLIQYCMEKVETVISNKEVCANLADDLAIIHEILTSLDSTENSKAEQYKLHRVMIKLYRITSRTNVLFDRCRSGKRRIMIRSFLFSTSIKEELQKLKAEIPVVIGMLCLVFHIKQTSAYSRGGTAIPKVNDKIFDEEDEEDMEEAEEYYADDED